MSICMTRKAGTPMKTIGLCMIVKDEAAVIERCLDSVRPLIDFVVVEDTGLDRRHTASHQENG